MIGRVEVTLKAEDCRGWRQQIEKLCHRTDQQRDFKGYLAPPWRRMMLLCVNKTRRSQGPVGQMDRQVGERGWGSGAHTHTHTHLFPSPCLWRPHHLGPQPRPSRGGRVLSILAKDKIAAVTPSENMIKQDRAERTVHTADAQWRFFPCTVQGVTYATRQCRTATSNNLLTMFIVRGLGKKNLNVFHWHFELSLFNIYIYFFEVCYIFFIDWQFCLCMTYLFNFMEF